MSRVRKVTNSLNLDKWKNQIFETQIEPVACTVSYITVGSFIHLLVPSVTFSTCKLSQVYLGNKYHPSKGSVNPIWLSIWNKGKLKSRLKSPPKISGSSISFLLVLWRTQFNWRKLHQWPPLMTRFTTKAP